MESTMSVALYARVSSQRQADELTIGSQVSALRQRIQQDGLKVEEDRCFLDEGYSGTTLLRPALERLRDLRIAASSIGCTCTRPTGWPASMSTKCFSWRNSRDTVWR